jgi:O-antigen/teichoic acid export membrane protein
MIVKNLLYSSSLPFVRFSIAILLTMLLTKNLAINDYGYWSLFLSLSGFVITIGSVNLMYSAQTILNTFNNTKKKLFISNIFSMKLLLTLLLGFIANIIFYIYEYFDIYTCIIFYIFILFRVIVDFYFGIFRALLKVKNQAIIIFIENFLTLLFIGVYFAISSDVSINKILTIIVFPQVIAAFYGFVTLKNYKITFSLDLKSLRPFFKISLPMIPFSYMDLIVSSISVFIIIHFLDYSNVGIYSLGQKIALIVTIPLSILGNIYIQIFNKGVYNKNKKLLFNLNIFVSLFILVSIIIGFLLTLQSENIILILSDREYLQAKTILPILIISNVLVSITNITNFRLLHKQENNFLFKLWTVLLCTYFPLSFLFTSKFGLIGTVSAFLMISLIGFSFSIFKLYISSIK